jgi:hypothetical protein
MPPPFPQVAKEQASTQSTRENTLHILHDLFAFKTRSICLENFRVEIAQVLVAIQRNLNQNVPVFI